MWKSFKSMLGGSSKKVEPSFTEARTVNFAVASDKTQKKTVTFGAAPQLPPGVVPSDLALKAENEDFEVVYVKQQPEVQDKRYDKIECKLTFKDLQFTKDDILPGEIIVLYQKKLVEVRIKKNQYVAGEFILTNYKVVFRPSDKSVHFNRDDYFKIPLGLVDRVERRNEGKRNQELQPKLVLWLKDTREIKFRFPMIDVMKKIHDEVNRFAFVTQKKQFFAYRYYLSNKEMEDKYEGWKLYNPLAEFERMGLKLMEHTDKVPTEFTSDFKIYDNAGGRLCSTYPSILVLPSRILYDYIGRAAKFRSRERLPALTYAIEVNGKLSTLFRCSQPKVGMSKNSNLQDQIMLRLIGDPKIDIAQEHKPGAINLRVFDARSYTAAFGNMLAGKGYELTEFYKNIEISFLDIPNIHSVRDSYLKLRQACYSEDGKFMSAMSDSGWYDMVFTILAGSRAVATSLLQGVNCLVHCSDGWDRTSQLCALSQIILDPYYRTMEGFQVLIQKDWISFGHMFCERMGQGVNKPNSEQKSPVFIQFIDCVSQLIYQFPVSFEFSIKYLSELVRQAQIHIYGTFLCDSQLQQLNAAVPKKTVSLWSYFKQHREQYLNPYYQPGWSRHLDVSPAQKNMRFFKEHFLYHAEGFRDMYSIYNCDWTDENPAVIHSQLKQQSELLRDRHMENEKTIAQLKEKIQKARRLKAERMQAAAEAQSKQQ